MEISKKKFRHTRQLMAMASRDGWTQEAIADACRTQQSVVSKWKNGTTLAREDQLTKLLDIYGPRLRRKTFRIYHDLRQENGDWSVHLIKVEGQVILTFPFENKSLCMQCHAEHLSCSCRPAGKKVAATRKIVVHEMGGGEFCCLSQKRLIKDEYRMHFPETNAFVTTVVGRFTATELLGYVDSKKWLGESGDLAVRGAEWLTLRMLVRKSLLEHGYPVEGVEEYRTV